MITLKKGEEKKAQNVQDMKVNPAQLQSASFGSSAELIYENTVVENSF